MKEKFLTLKFPLLMAVAVIALFSACSKDDETSSGEKKKPEEKIVLPPAQIKDTTAMTFLNLPYYRVNFTYPSVGSDGVTPTTLSSAIVLPDDIFKKELIYSTPDGTQKYHSKGMILSCHFTITSNKEAPTEAKELQIEGALGTLGASEWITIAPDYSGFGVTASSPQAYLQADVTARQCLDAYKSAKELLQAKGYNYGPHQALLGYSQGAHVAMSVQRYLSTTNQEQPFEKTFAGGGPYDIEEMLKSYLEPDTKTYYPCAIGLVFVGVNDSKKLGLDYSKVFREPFDKKMAAWISCKEMTTDEINDSVYVLLNSDVKKGVLVSDIINTSYVNPGNVELSAFFDNVRSNTLLSNWKPQSNGDYFLYHSSEDQVVPYFCYEHMINYLTSNGVDSKRLKTFTATGAHTNAALLFVMKSLEELAEVE